MKTFDLIVIGGGRAAGIAKNAANNGKKVALIEKSSLGGTCPNRGCIPSKLLIGHAHAIRAIQNSEAHFITASIDQIDRQKIFDASNAYVNTIEGLIEKGIPEGVTIFKGEGKFISDKEIVVNNETITADTIVIGTGGRPRKTVHEKSWTSDNLFPLDGGIPKSVTIVGAGFIGVELANFFDAIGVNTLLIAKGSELLSREDKEIGAIFKEEFTKHVDVKFDTGITSATHDGKQFTMELETTSGEKTTHTTEVIIETIGRTPNTDNLGLENTAISTNKRGYIKRNNYCETSVKGVYAVGDVASKYALQHIAAHEVSYLSSHLLENNSAPLSYKYVPHAVFSDPEIASVGMTEEDAIAQNIRYVSSTTNWAASAKARSTKLSYQRTKFIVHADTYEILGCHIIGPDSSTLLHQVLSVMHIENDIRHLANMMYIHPAVNEVILAAARAVIKKIG